MDCIEYGGVMETFVWNKIITMTNYMELPEIGGQLDTVGNRYNTCVINIMEFAKSGLNQEL